MIPICRSGPRRCSTSPSSRSRGKVIRPATGYLGPNGVVRGRPPLRDRAKRQVTLRLDPDVIDRFREGGPGWQGRINEALRKAVGL